MTPDYFQTDSELCYSLTSFYEGILKVPGAGGLLQPKIIKHSLTTKICLPSFRIAGSDSWAPTPVPAPEAAEGVAAPESPAAAEHPAAAKPGKDVKASSKSSR